MRALRLTPPRQMSLEQCMEFLADDELLEVTPKNLRIRKRILDHSQRMKALKGNKSLKFSAPVKTGAVFHAKTTEE